VGETIPDAQNLLYKALTIANFDHVIRDLSWVSLSPDRSKLLTVRNGVALLWKTDGAPLLDLESRAGPVSSASFSPDGGKIAARSEEGTLQVWRSDGTFVSAFKGEGPDPPSWSPLFSPDGNLLLIQNAEGALELWSTDGSRNATLAINDEVWAVSFSPSGRTLVVSGCERKDDGSCGKGFAQLWSANGRLIRTLEGEIDPSYWIGFSSSGQTFITLGNVTAQLWSADGALIQTLELKKDEFGEADPISYVEFSPNGDQIVVIGDQGTLELWQADGTRSVRLREPERHGAGLFSAVAFSPDEKQLMTAICVKFALGSCLENVVDLWQVDGRHVAQLADYPGEGVQAGFSPNGKLRFTAGCRAIDPTLPCDYVVELRGINQFHTGTLKGITNQLYWADFDQDGERVLTYDMDGTIRIWRTDLAFPATDQFYIDPTAEGRSFSGWSASFSPNGSRFAVSYCDGAVPSNRCNFGSVQLFHVNGDASIGLDEERAYGSYAVVFSPDGRSLATGDDSHSDLWRADGNFISTLEGYNPTFNLEGSELVTVANGVIRRWRNDGTLVSVSGVYTGGVQAISFKPDGIKLLVGGCEHYDSVNQCPSVPPGLYRADGTLISALGVYTDGLPLMGFSPDQSLVYSAGCGQASAARKWVVGLAQIYRDDGTLIGQLDGHRDRVLAVSISADNQRVVTASADGTARIWRASGELIAELKGHTSAVNFAGFNQDGRLIITASQDGTARLWRADGAFVTRLDGDASGLVWAGFSPDGLRIVTVSGNGTTQVWPLYGDTDAMVAEAERRLGRTLTEEECQQHLGRACP
jgi:WD40 repeat protein